MFVLLSLWFLFFGVIGLVLMLRFSPRGEYYLLGSTLMFGMGYYFLPCFFSGLSGLEVSDGSRTFPALLMGALFIPLLVLGNFLGCRVFRENRGFRARELDYLVLMKPNSLFWICFSVWLFTYFSITQTSYAAVDFNAYFLDGDEGRGAWGAVSGVCLAGMAILLTHEWTRRGDYRLALAIAYGSTVLLQLATAQRLSVITPLFTLVAALSLAGPRGSARNVLLVGVLVLVLVSPLMVALREFQGLQGEALAKVWLVFNSFRLTGGDGIDSFLRSLLDRSDLVEVSGHLKNYIDSSGHVGYKYYASVLQSFIPRFVIGDKLVLLSDDGTIYGTLSVIAWNLLAGNSIGSLSAFGPIVAYWEGGWIWLCFNGLLTGWLYAWLHSRFGGGGASASWLYCSLFVSASIKTAPPSFFELVVSVSTLLVAYFLAVYFFRLLIVAFQWRSAS